MNDRYELGQVIGHGGMSTVHRAYDRRTGREVAVKTSRPTTDMADADGRTRREIDLLAALDDPGLVAVLDADVGDGATPAYLVTELVNGPTLAQWMRHSPLTEQQTARLGAAMCRTLAYIHYRGIVHCDVKPANILISGTSEADLGTPKLADFGIAMAVNSACLTADGARVGTANYLSPEQARGDPVSPATDIYSLGLVLIEALTYRGSGVETALARPNRSTTGPHYASRGMRILLADMTARDPRDRPAAGQAARILEEIATAAVGSLADEILMLDRPTTEPEEQQFVGTRNGPRRRLVLAAAAAVVLAGCAALTATLSSTGSKPPTTAPRAAPYAALPNQSAPSPPGPMRAAPPKTGPALRHQPAPTPPPAQIAATAPLLHQRTDAHPNGSPKHHRKDKGEHREGKHGTDQHAKHRHATGKHSKHHHAKGKQPAGQRHEIRRR